jgi:hypothetical protein
MEVNTMENKEEMNNTNKRVVVLLNEHSDIDLINFLANRKAGKTIRDALRFYESHLNNPGLSKQDSIIEYDYGLKDELILQLKSEIKFLRELILILKQK